MEEGEGFVSLHLVFLFLAITMHLHRETRCSIPK